MIRTITGALAGTLLVIVAFAVLVWAQPVHAAECRTISVSWYGNEHHGGKTASGAIFDQWALTAAMPIRKHLGERWRLSYEHRSVTVKVTDTGSFEKYGRGMDLARGAFRKLASEGKGVLHGVRACRVG